jgi:hypothetical protein
MSEVVKGKPGRKPMNKESKPTNPKFYEEDPQPEHKVVVEEKPKAFNSKLYSGKCRKFMLHRVPEGGPYSNWAFAGPGTLPPMRIQRGQTVILPEEYFECFKSAGVDVLKCDMDFPTGGRPEYYTSFETNYPYQDFGEATWEEYLAFKSGDDKKVHPNKAQKR